MTSSKLLNINRTMPLGDRLRQMHDHLLQSLPEVDRIACALYDPAQDTLRTFINSTRKGIALGGYEFKLSDSTSLKQLAETGQFRALDDIPDAISPTTPHARWLLEQGYRSSFTVPMYANGALLGFIFFDSMQPCLFSAKVQRDLILFCSLINMEIASDQSVARSILSSIQLARDFANMRDFETGAHLERMARYSHIIARAVAPDFGLSDEFVEHIQMFAILHDIGKIGIPDRILLKRGPLTAEERQVMQTHVDKGVVLIEKIIADLHLGDTAETAIMRNIVGCHHEHLDGSGYPRGLRGDAVPVEARIVAVADIFDAMTSYRPYKDGWDVHASLNEIRRMAALGKLDPLCVAALEHNLDEMLSISLQFRDGEEAPASTAL